ncbi:MAG: S46 family peptidase [Ignavibacteria bacterium]|nr:S46 family peptidase [Ignavibacteria bacterium]
MIYRFKNSKIIISIILFVIMSIQPLFAQANFNPDTVKAQKFDTGKMWSFDYPPFDYFEKTYGFKPTQEWFDDVRLSALRVPGCTSSFVSGDGLMMTNYHCAEGLVRRVQKEGEDLINNGFFAKTLADERKIPNYYTEKLVFIKDVSEEVHDAIAKGTTNEEKAKIKEEKSKELVELYKKETGLNCQFVSLFNGGKFSIYGYKRYDDVRLVFVPEYQAAYFGGDYDNFTYPRYNLDCAFLRAYENDQPVKAENFFKFSTNGIQLGEPIFTVGNPGFTQRLKTVAFLEYQRDVTYRNNSYLFDSYFNVLETLKSIAPDKKDEYEQIRRRIGNAQKVFHQTYKGLTDPYLLARKQAFEKEIKEKVFANKSLKEKYGGIWENISKTRTEMKEIGPKISAYTLNNIFSSQYFLIARDLVKFAKEMQKPEAERDAKYKGEKLDSTINSLYPEKLDKLLEVTKLKIQADFIRMNLGNQNPIVMKLFSDKSGKDAADYILANSVMDERDKFISLAKKDAEKILNSNDPFVYFIIETQDKITELQNKSKEITSTEQVFDDMLGEVVFMLYSTNIPPDANFTLRISDGVLQNFDYNGTIAPTVTTFYGMYDRHYSFYKEYPWNIAPSWDEPSKVDLATPFNFTSTNDIVGGNSGSAVINKNAEVVGLAFDGNMESIYGNFIYMTHNNRCISVDARGMMEAFEKVYKADRFVNELKEGKLP